MMYDLQGALLLSVGNKAKTRGSSGLILVVSVFYLVNECYWYVNWVNAQGHGGWYGCGGSYSRVEEFARTHGVDLDANIWLPVEMTFLDTEVPQAKHDGKLDNDNDCYATYTDIDGKVGVLIESNVAWECDSLRINLKQALSLLAWLKQEEPTVKQLVKEVPQ